MCCSHVPPSLTDTYSDFCINPFGLEHRCRVQTLIDSVDLIHCKCSLVIRSGYPRRTRVDIMHRVRANHHMLVYHFWPQHFETMCGTCTAPRGAFASAANSPMITRVAMFNRHEPIRRCQHGDDLMTACIRHISSRCPRGQDRQTASRTDEPPD